MSKVGVIFTSNVWTSSDATTNR